MVNIIQSKIKNQSRQLASSHFFDIFFIKKTFSYSAEYENVKTKINPRHLEGVYF